MTAHEAIAAIKAELERQINEERDGCKTKLDDFAKTRLGVLEELKDFLDTLEAENAPSCRSCGFYENNCPFIRGKFIPYPSKVCKDYTYSEMKAVEDKDPVLDIESKKYFGRYHYNSDGIIVDMDGEPMLFADLYTIAEHFHALGKNSK